MPLRPSWVNSASSTCGTECCVLSTSWDWPTARRTCPATWFRGSTRTWRCLAAPAKLPWRSAKIALSSRKGSDAAGRRRLAASLEAQEEDQGAGFLHTYILAIFRCGPSVSSLATPQEAKIACALATNCCHSMLSLQRTSFHLTLSFEKSLYGCIPIPTMLQRVCSECEFEQAFLMCCGTLFPKYVVGLSTVSGEENRKYRQV